MTARETVAIKIKEARCSMGLTQEEFGELIGLAGCTVSQYEKGVRGPDVDGLAKISEVTGLPVGHFFSSTGGNTVPRRTAANRATAARRGSALTKNGNADTHFPARIMCQSAA